MKMIEKRWVTFRKVKGHAGDEWNTRVDKLEVQGRGEQAKEMCVKILIHTSSLASEQV
jgi:ribonuclease HI